VFSRLIATVVV